jgi:hypothetical protein
MSNVQILVLVSSALFATAAGLMLAVMKPAKPAKPAAKPAAPALTNEEKEKLVRYVTDTRGPVTPAIKEALRLLAVNANKR